MTKDVLICISGLQMDVMEADSMSSEPIEVITPATYYCKNGKHYVIYDEVMEGIPGSTKNKIKITGDHMMEIMKSGVSNTHMVFEKNKKNLTYYDTPYGQLLIGIHTTDMSVNVTEQDIHVNVDYGLDINHEPLAECKIRMNIKSKITGDSTIRDGMIS